MGGEEEGSMSRRGISSSGMLMGVRRRSRWKLEVKHEERKGDCQNRELNRLRGRKEKSKRSGLLSAPISGESLLL